MAGNDSIFAPRIRLASEDISIMSNVVGKAPFCDVSNTSAEGPIQNPDEAVDLLKGTVLQISNHHSFSQTDRLSVLDMTAKMLNMAFPKQEATEFLVENSWAVCSKYVGHVQHLAKVCSEEKRKGGGAAIIKAGDELQELLANAAWYLFETGECEAAYDLAITGCELFSEAERKTSKHYAHLCNTQGVVLFEWNRLAESRAKHNEGYGIRQQLEPLDHMLLHGSIMNLGQVACASGDLDEAEAKYNEADGEYEAALREHGAKEFEQDNAVTNMIKARYWLLRGSLDKARPLLVQARTILEKSDQVDGMAVLLAYLTLEEGHLLMLENAGDKDGDKDHDKYIKLVDVLEEGLRLVLKEAPKHGLVAGLCYKLGQVYYNQEHLGKIPTGENTGPDGYQKCLELCDQGIEVANHRKLHGDKARLLLLKVECLRGVMARMVSSGGYLGDEEGNKVVEGVATALRRRSEEAREDAIKAQGAAADASLDELVCAYVR